MLFLPRSIAPFEARGNIRRRHQCTLYVVLLAAQCTHTHIRGKRGRAGPLPLGDSPVAAEREKKSPSTKKGPLSDFPCATALALAVFTHVGVGAAVDPRAHEGDELVAALVHHEAAHWKKGRKKPLK